MKKIRIITTIIALMLMCSIFMGASSCESDLSSYSMSSDENNSDIKLTFEAYLYDNQGNNYATFKGNSFNISPNKVRQWGYNTNGSWSSWYETSSVVSIEIDGHNIQTCGSTIVF